MPYRLQPIPLPDGVIAELAEKDHVVTSYSANVVEFDRDGNIIGSAPLYDCYLHQCAPLAPTIASSSPESHCVISIVTATPRTPQHLR